MKIAIITGASSGLGREYFRQLNAADYDEIWLVARREEKLNATAALRSDVKARVTPLDITKDGAAKMLADMVGEQGAEVGMLINNAGYGLLGYVYELSSQAQAGIVRLNNEALVALTAELLCHMKKGAKIINICSIASFTPNIRMSVYSASKAFVMSFSRSLREELKPEKINVLAVCPGPMDTEFLPCAGIGAGDSKTFETLPYCDPAKVVKGSLKASGRNKPVYTPRALYKLYRVLGKLTPKCIMMKFAKT